MKKMRKKNSRKKLKNTLQFKKKLEICLFPHLHTLAQKNARENTSLETQKTPIKHSKEAPISNKNT